MRNGLFCERKHKKRLAKRDWSTSFIQKTAPEKEAVGYPGSFVRFPLPSQQGQGKRAGPPDPPTGKSLPFPWWEEGMGKKKEEDFYRGIMPMMTANSMHRMENTQT